MTRSHQWLSLLGSSRTGTPSWRKVSLPDDTPSHSIQAKQAEQGWGQEWFCHKVEWQVRPQVKPAKFGQHGWAQALLQHSSGQEQGAPAQTKGKTCECNQGWTLICSAVHLLCSTLHSNCTCWRERTGHSSRNSYQLWRLFWHLQTTFFKYCSMMIGGKQIKNKSSSELALSCSSTTTDLVSAFVLRLPAFSSRQACFQFSPLSLTLLSIFKHYFKHI